MLSSNSLVGIDLGGTKTEIAVIQNNGNIYFRHRVSTPQSNYPAVLNTICNLISLARTECDLSNNEPIGLGIPGCYDHKAKKVRGANTQILNGKNIKKDLTDRLKCEVSIDNDANCLALSESVDGSAKNADLVFAVIIGTGCGSGLSFKKELWSGQNFLAGEWGHNPIPWLDSSEPFRLCWCGKKNCIETWLSGPGFSLTHALNVGEKVSPINIVNRARRGDKGCVQSLKLYLTHLGKALASVVNILDPDMIVLGGGLSQIKEIYQNVPQIITTYSFTKSAHTPIKKAYHGDSSGVRGAAWLSKPQQKVN